MDITTTWTTILLALPVVLLAFLLPVALVVALQVWLCRRESRWLGLILPALSLLVSLVLVLSVAFARGGNSSGVQVYDEQGNLVEEYVQTQPSRLEPGQLLLAGGVFLVGNIPTVVLGGIWLYHKNRRDLQEDLKKMHIQDLE